MTTTIEEVTERGTPKPTLRQRLGEAMAHQRQRKGLTQLELATAAEISTKYLGEVERGEANVSIDVVERIAAVLDWDPYRLFATDPPPIDESVRTGLIRSVGVLQGTVSTQVSQLLETLNAISTTARVLNGTTMPAPAEPDIQVEAAVAQPHALNGTGAEHELSAKAL